jgi:DnaJ domain
MMRRMSTAPWWKLQLSLRSLVPSNRALVGTSIPQSPYCFWRALSTSATWRNLSPYGLLGVSTNASEKEIKLAYFKAAKASHPDLNPGDKSAEEKFKRVAAAYELLRDPARRRMYDMGGTGSWGSSRQQQQQRQQRQGPHSQRQSQSEAEQNWWSEHQQGQGQQKAYYHAADLFQSVLKDYTVIQEALSNYVTDVTEEFTYAYDCATRGDWKEAMEVARANSGLLWGVILPSILILRHPLLVTGIIGFGGRSLIYLLLVSNNLPRASAWLWQKALQIAHERNKRRAMRRR